MSDFFRLNFVDQTEQEDEEEGVILEIDDNLPVLERIQRYKKSELPLHRLHIVRSLPEAGQELGVENTIKCIVPILEDFVHDSEPSIRQALLEQIPLLADLLLSQTKKQENSQNDNNQVQKDEAYSQMLHVLVPITAELTTDMNQQVRFCAAESLVNLASKARHQDIEPYFLPIIKSLANDTTEEEHRLEAAELVTHIAPYVSEELFNRALLPLVVKLSEDPSFKIRKALCNGFGNICKASGDEVASAFLLPVFLILCQDEIWGVRKACAESIVSVGLALPKTVRSAKLIPALETLIDDQSRWVKGAAFQNLGKFISILDSSQVTSKFLSRFTGMVSSGGKTIGDTDLVWCCAFNFPAVLLTVGADRWEELKQTYFSLVRENAWKVRRTISCSLHEIAKILGTQTTESALLPVFELCIRDLDEVRSGILEHLADFLGVLSASYRTQYLSLINEMLLSKNWRFRKILAKQLPELFFLYDAKTNVDLLGPSLIKLCHDDVSKVRQVASKKLGSLLSRLKNLDASAAATDVTNQILQLATNSSYSKRQLFLIACEGMLPQLQEDETLLLQVVPELEKLAFDPVPNVRLCLTKLLKAFSSNACFSRTDLKTILDKLVNDKDKDVSFFAKQIAIIEPAILQEQQTTNKYDSSDNEPESQQTACVAEEKNTAE